MADETTTSAAAAPESPTPVTPEETNSLAAAPVFLVTARVKDYIAKAGLRTAGATCEELNRELMRLIDRAINRCRDNDRQTVKPTDV